MEIIDFTRFWEERLDSMTKAVQTHHLEVQENRYGINVAIEHGPQGSWMLRVTTDTRQATEKLCDRFSDSSLTVSPSLRDVKESLANIFHDWDAEGASDALLGLYGIFYGQAAFADQRWEDAYCDALYRDLANEIGSDAFSVRR